MEKELTKRQKKTLSKHKKHHTKKHMDFMIRKMMGGMSFSASHKLAMKKVGE